MRKDCKNYESRTYPSGDTVRMCRLDLAPEAPWRCPEECPGFQRKMVDGGWVHGSLVGTHSDDDDPHLDEGAVSMLDQAEDIVNAAGPEIISDVTREREAQRRKATKKWRWWPFGRR